MHPLKRLSKKVFWQWTKQQQEAFDDCEKFLTEHVQLYTPRQGCPFELEETILDDTVWWGLWQLTGLNHQKEPVGFWSKVLQGLAIHYTLMEK